MKTPIRDLWKDLVRDESGATAVEYGLIAVLAVIGLITAMSQIGGHTSNNFSRADTSMGGGN